MTRVKAVVLMLLVLCEALWLFTAGLFSCFVPFVVLLLCFVDPVSHCDHLVWKKGVVFLTWTCSIFLTFHAYCSLRRRGGGGGGGGGGAAEEEK